MLNLPPIILEDLESIIKEPISWEKLKNKTVLITGVNGMIASYIVYTLLYLNDVQDLQCKVIGTVRNMEKAKSHFGDLLTCLNFEVVAQDVSEFMPYEGNIDYIIHAASQTGPNQFINDPVGTIKGNILGTMNLLDLACQKDVKKFMYLSTREIYGKVSGETERVEESTYGTFDHVTVRSSYPESKRMAETVCEAYGKQYDIPYVICRIEHTFGPGMSLGDGRVMSDFINNVVKGEPIIMKSEGLVKLNLTYLADLVTGLFYSLLNFNDNIYNISTNASPIMVKDLAELLADLFKNRGITVKKHIPLGEQGKGYLPYRIPVLDSTKAISQGWSCKVPLRAGLQRIVDFYSHD